MYSAKDIARYTVTKCTREKCPISNLQLQKILYNIQKAFLQGGRDAAFGDEMEAWRLGPVVPNVYYEYCGYGAMPITEQYDIQPDQPEQEDRAVMDPIIEKKRAMRPWELVEETHKRGGAWDLTVKEKGLRARIPMDLIREKG